jgi:uncharacterized ion transporter superfamily protein YfcC
MAWRDEVLETADPPASAAPGPATSRDAPLLAIVLFPFIPYVVGVLRFDWGFNELSGLFLVAAFGVGLVSGRSLSETAAAFLKAMEGMLSAALFVGVARGISVALGDDQVLDTIVHGLASPLAAVPGVLAGALMIPIHALLHIPVPSVSGQAVLTMPIMAPLSDVLGLSRDAAVIAYQTGAGLMDMLTPTNGALFAMLLGAGASYGRWLRFALPGAPLVALVGLVGVVLAG